MADERQEDPPSEGGDVSTSLSNRVEDKKKKAVTRGPSYTKTENLAITKSWIKATNDHVKGVDQTVENYQDAMAANYAQYIVEEAKMEASLRSTNARLNLGTKKAPVVKYCDRTGSSLHQRFVKTISPEVMKWQGVLQITKDGEPKYESGENEALYYERIQELYKAKYGKSFDYTDCWQLLRLEPKWGDWVTKSEKSTTSSSQKKARRPKGSKSYMEELKEKELIRKTLNEAGISKDNPIDLDGSSVTGTGGKDVALASVAGSLQQFAAMGMQYLTSSMMGLNQETAASLVSDEDKRALIAAQIRLQAAQARKQALDLEEENERRSKKAKTAEKDSDDAGKVDDGSSDDD